MPERIRFKPLVNIELTPDQNDVWSSHLDLGDYLEQLREMMCP